ncbi:MAG: hypothetical protein KKA73_07770 [Chloroflexi bacterium]|nr:hypothetical protein [Chloroflexota bacterium]MBU1747570.1 hypothetical protein [Chloroflexota bacterium]MBU1878314.1 hypothetical protein [Chloroflexota bacterium]
MSKPTGQLGLGWGDPPTSPSPPPPASPTPPAPIAATAVAPGAEPGDKPAIKHTCGMCRQMVKANADATSGVCRLIFGRQVQVKTSACDQIDADPDLVKKYAPPPPPPKPEPKPARAKVNTKIRHRAAPPADGWAPYEKPASTAPAVLVIARIHPGPGRVGTQPVIVTTHQTGQMPSAARSGRLADLPDLVRAVVEQHYQTALELERLTDELAALAQEQGLPGAFQADGTLHPNLVDHPEGQEYLALISAPTSADAAADDTDPADADEDAPDSADAGDDDADPADADEDDPDSADAGDDDADPADAGDDDADPATSFDDEEE